MLLRTDDSGVLAIGQSSHAWISGQLARAWGNERFPAPEPWEEVCLAAEQHDIGMAEWDLAPARDPATGLPFSFMEMPLDTHVGLWTAAPRKLLSQNRYAALLVSMHGLRLYERRNLSELPEREAGLVRDYLAGQRELQRELLASLRADPSTASAAEEGTVIRNSQLIWIWDYMSLVICLDWAPRPLHDVPARDGPAELRLAPAGEPHRLELKPWPFAAPQIAVRCEGRRLDYRYSSDRALRGALAAARWETIEFELLSR